MRRLRPRELRRMLRRMGIEASELEGVRRVIIETEDRRITIDGPMVSVMEVGREKIYQIIGGEVTEEELLEEIEIPEEDVQLVAQQAGVSPEVAREALRQTKGDLAQAILLCKSRKQ